MEQQLFEVESRFIASEEKADLKIAEIHQKATKARDIKSYVVDESSELCPCCSMPADAPLFSICCSAEDLGDLGVGISLYYFFVQRIMLWFLWSFLFAGIFAIYTNSEAGNAGDWGRGTHSWYIASSLGGYGKSENPTVVQGILHAANCGFLIIFYYWLIVGLSKLSRNVDKDNITPADFTIWVQNLNKNFIDRDLKAFLEERCRNFGIPGNIYSISIAYDIGRYVSNTKQQDKLKGELIYIRDYQKKNKGKYPKKFSICCYSKKYPAEGRIQAQIDELDRRIKNYEEKTEERYHQTQFAFVTFTRQENSKEFLQFWPNGFWSNFSNFLSSICMNTNNVLFNGRFLKIEKAPEPSDIIWENLNATACQKHTKRAVTFILTTFLLAGSFLLVFLTKKAQRDQYSSYEDKSEDKRTYSELFQVRFFSFGLSVCIVLINRAIAIIVRIFTADEKHYTWSTYNKSVTNKLVLALVLNTVGIIIWINSESKKDLFLPYGLVNDILFLLLTDAIVSPLTYIFSPLYLYKVYLRRKIRNQAKKGIIGLTQIEANKIWENPQVDMAQRYSNILKTLLVCFIFAPLFPLGLAIGLGSVIIEYWTDKIILLRRHSRPRTYGDAMSKNMLNWIPILILAYATSNCIFQYIMYKENLYFPLGGLCACLVIFLAPCKCFLKKLNTTYIPIQDGENDNYEDSAINFNEDYLRNNPLTAKEGWSEWLNLVERKRGKEEKEKLAEVLAPKLNSTNMLRNYASQQAEIEAGERHIASRPNILNTLWSSANSREKLNSLLVGSKNREISNQVTNFVEGVSAQISSLFVGSGRDKSNSHF
ncbi:unnamed protein product [Blepharisma stoltei]|uniref:CSC1/OSCA1-like cytosolic domain-containing protein n=1 Tax=Blepharisma stoltei TaxID=1481888 RepID=A0AAU9K589_9CILI|nr:unnamed protein product [Blepharisma stoltei]